jgi:hypothetical protein
MTVLRKMLHLLLGESVLHRDLAGRGAHHVRHLVRGSLGSGLSGGHGLRIAAAGTVQPRSLRGGWRVFHWRLRSLGHVHAGRIALHLLAHHLGLLHLGHVRRSGSSAHFNMSKAKTYGFLLPILFMKTPLAGMSWPGMRCWFKPP